MHQALVGQETPTRSPGSAGSEITGLAQVDPLRTWVCELNESSYVVEPTTTHHWATQSTPWAVSNDEGREVHVWPSAVVHSTAAIPVAANMQRVGLAHER
jgi:hypothetical protein